MTLWLWILSSIALLILAVGVAFALWVRHSGRTAQEASAELRAMGLDMMKLPGRLRRLAADDRVPRSARWMLIGLAIYIASPIDLIPDFLPVIGQLDDIIIIPLVLMRVRRMIPQEVWDTYFPERPGSGDRLEDTW